MSSSKGRCTSCGNEIVDFNLKNEIGVCNNCGNEYVSINASEFSSVDEKRATDIDGLRKLLHQSIMEDSAEDIEVYAKEILQLIPKDFSAGYYFAYSKRVLGNPFHINKFYKMNDGLISTNEEQVTIIKHVLEKCELKDKYALIDFVKKLFKEATDKMRWRDRLDERIRTLEIEEENEQIIERDVFVCYDKADEKLAKSLCEEIEISDLKCWIHPRNLRANFKDEQEEINAGIRSCKNVLVLSTFAATESEKVMNEVMMAIEYGVNLIEFKVDDSVRSDFFLDAIGTNYIDASGKPDNFYGQLVQKIKETSKIAPSEEGDELFAELKRKERELMAEQEKIDALEREQKDRNRKAEEEKIQKEKLLKEKMKEEEEERRKASEQIEKEQINRMEQMMFDSFDTSKVSSAKIAAKKDVDIEKMLDKVDKLIQIGEVLMALDICEEIVLKFPHDYRGWFAYVKLETNNLTDLKNTSHIIYIEKAILEATPDEKKKIEKLYKPFRALREKTSVYRELSICLMSYLNQQAYATKLCGEGIKAYKKGDIEAAVKLWSVAARYENREAQYCMALQYISGRFIGKDLMKAEQLLVTASSYGNEKAMFTLGDIYEKGSFGIKQNHNRSVEFYRMYASKGTIDAVNHVMKIAHKYEREMGISMINNAVAIKYYEIAADAGNLKAIMKAADIHATGIGSMFDREKAVKYYEKAAEKGDQRALETVADIYHKGLYDVIKDNKRFVSIYEDLAKKYPENEEYQNRVISFYEHGVYGVKRDHKRVFQIYNDLGVKGYGGGIYLYHLGEIYEHGLLEVKKDEKQAVKIYFDLINRYPNNQVYQIKMADIFEHGMFGVVRDRKKAALIYTNLVNRYQDNAMYQYKLALSYLNSGESNNLVLSFQHFEKAYDLGQREAGYYLVSMYYGGDEKIPRDYARACRICEEIDSKIDYNAITTVEHRMYDDMKVLHIKMYDNGGYGIDKDSRMAKDLRNAYNDAHLDKIKIK